VGTPSDHGSDEGADVPVLPPKKQALRRGAAVGRRRRPGDLSLPLSLRPIDFKSTGLYAYMGKVHRNCITGRVHLRRLARSPGYSIVDLCSRPVLSGTLQDFLEDKFLFRMVPLGYRTWLYHDLYRQQKAGQLEFPESLIHEVLSHRCVDAPTNGGRWSPLVIYAPLCMFTSLMCDVFLIVLAVLLVAAIFTLEQMMNTAEGYKYARLASLPIRLGFLCLLLWRAANGPAKAEGIQGLRTLGAVISVALALLDICLGDGNSLASYRFLCKYEVLREMPGRVFICQRHGAAHQEDAFGPRGAVDQCVTDMGAWKHNYSLIADLKGLVVELRPVDPEEWKAAAELYYKTKEVLPYVTLPVFLGEESE